MLAVAETPPCSCRTAQAALEMLGPTTYVVYGMRLAFKVVEEELTIVADIPIPELTVKEPCMRTRVSEDVILWECVGRSLLWMQKGLIAQNFVTPASLSYVLTPIHACTFKRQPTFWYTVLSFELEDKASWFAIQSCITLCDVVSKGIASFAG